MQVTARISGHAVFETPQFGYSSEFRTLTDQAPKFILRGLPPTSYVVSIKDPQQRWTFRPLDPVLAFSGNEIRFMAQMEVGVVVSGRLLDPEGKPIASAGVSAIVDRQNQADP